MDKHLIAYLWDDAPVELKAQVCTRGTPQMLWVVPERWVSRSTRFLFPAAIVALLTGDGGTAWGHLERFHQPDGTVLIVGYRRPRT